MAPRTWREYFAEQFANDPRFVVDDSSELTLVKSTGASATQIEIEYGTHENQDEFHDIYFVNEDSPGWCRMVWRDRMIGDGFNYGDTAFTAENIARVEQWLAVPLYAGWKEEAFYLAGEHVKSKLRWTQAGQVVKITQYMQDVGCLLSLFQRIRYSKLFGEAHMESRVVVIKPMIAAGRQSAEADGALL